MKSRFRFSLLFVALALTAQLSISTPSLAVGQNANSSMEANQNSNMGIPSSQCRRRCTATYRRCLRAADGNPGRRRACAVHYRNCLRRCPQ